MVSLRADSDFSFDSRNNSPYDSAPQSPQGFNNYFFSAPTSPYNYNHQISFSFAPDQYHYHHACDEKPFAFFRGDDLDLVPVSSADEVLDGGKNKSCEPKRKKMIQKTLSFGRDSKVCSQRFQLPEETVKDSSSSSSSSSSLSFSWLYKKWKLKDLLFRNASEGHETNNKYDFLRKIKNDELKNSSSSTNSVRNGNNCKKKNKERATLSAHEKHYKVNRAAAEELKKRTYLPYKQNLMIGCVNHDAVSVRDPSRTTLKIR